MWVGNVYLPPAGALVKRGVDEHVARSHVEDILADIPSVSRAIVGGDFNCRVGAQSPNIAGLQLRREAADLHVCPRAGWMLEQCELHALHILNGTQAGVPAQHTCHTSQGASCVDFLLARDGSLPIYYDESALAGLSDHTLLRSLLPTALMPTIPGVGATAASGSPPAGCTYKW